MISRRTAPIAALVAVVLCALLFVAAFVVPFYSGTSSYGRTGHATLVQVNGARVLLVFAFPLVITLIGLIFVRSRAARPVLLVVCGLMWLGTLLTGFTVGFLYLPVDIALLVAVAAVPSRRPPMPISSPYPPGWYPDPSGAPTQLRWWDGFAWTASVTATR